MLSAMYFAVIPPGFFFPLFLFPHGSTFLGCVSVQCLPPLLLFSGFEGRRARWPNAESISVGLLHERLHDNATHVLRPGHEQAPKVFGWLAAGQPTFLPARASLFFSPLFSPLSRPALFSGGLFLPNRRRRCCWLWGFCFNLFAHFSALPPLSLLPPKQRCRANFILLSVRVLGGACFITDELFLPRSAGRRRRSLFRSPACA